MSLPLPSDAVAQVMLLLSAASLASDRNVRATYVAAARNIHAEQAGKMAKAEAAISDFEAQLVRANESAAPRLRGSR